MAFPDADLQHRDVPKWRCPIREGPGMSQLPWRRPQLPRMTLPGSRRVASGINPATCHRAACPTGPTRLTIGRPSPKIFSVVRVECLTPREQPPEPSATPRGHAHDAARTGTASGKSSASRPRSDRPGGHEGLGDCGGGLREAETQAGDRDSHQSPRPAVHDRGGRRRSPPPAARGRGSLGSQRAAEHGPPGRRVDGPPAVRRHGGLVSARHEDRRRRGGRLDPAGVRRIADFVPHAEERLLFRRHVVQPGRADRPREIPAGRPISRTST